MRRMPCFPGALSLILIVTGALVLVFSLPGWAWPGALGLALVLAGVFLWQRC